MAAGALTHRPRGPAGAALQPVEQLGQGAGAGAGRHVRQGWARGWAAVVRAVAVGRLLQAAVVAGLQQPQRPAWARRQVVVAAGRLLWHRARAQQQQGPAAAAAAAQRRPPARHAPPC